MQRLPKFPSDPTARLRVLSLGFALFVTLANALGVAVDPAAPLLYRVVGPIASLVLAVMFVRGFRRSHFPPGSWILEAALLFVVAQPSTMPLRGLGVFYASCQ